MKLVLEDLTVYKGKGMALKNSIGEVIVVNAMVGYQEIISDPIYYGKLVCLSYPLIGNYGITDEDDESKKTQISGLIVREYNDKPSNFRFTKTLKEVLEDHGISLLSNIDTRSLVNHLNSTGNQMGIIVTDDISEEEAIKAIKAHKTLKQEYDYNTKVYYSRTSNYKYTVCSLDFGINRSLISILNSLNVNVVVVPYNYDIEKIKELNPDGIVLSNGPENVNIFDKVQPLIKQLIGYKPILAIGMGHEIVAYSHGLKLEKMKKGHYSCNHPIKDLKKNKIFTMNLANQYIVVNDSENLKCSHINILTNTIEGLHSVKDKIITFQADISTSNKDHIVYFEEFVELMKGSKANA